MTPMPILILHTGDPEAGLARRHGSYAEMLRRAAGLAPSDVHIVAVHEGQQPEEPARYRAALITGSPAMVTDREAWSEACAGWLREAADAGLPMFGICYGHQLLAHALGGEVGYNPAGRELGTHEIVLTPAAQEDPLLAGLPRTLPAQMMHAQSVITLPAGSVVLASSPMDGHQMLRLRPGVYSTQFHPEFQPEFVRDHIAHHADGYIREGLDTTALRAAVADTAQAGSLLARFVACYAAEPRAA
ncbi:GMP synthase [Bordetella genomosp. 12]|uniref:GMP synthase n=2 Tax=Bordetella genomosp. 12 TaxID=463035 RepID=A0A261VML7_9BORD|nr:glutamine amidotransferase [Bordetella genomosp. 12]OZI74732.1 GMP synthase [Bordetella genomosp. 12]